MKQLVSNNVAMQGKGWYNSHAALQTEAMLEALSLFEGQYAIDGNSTITLVEYGSSEGVNSILPFQQMLQQILLCSPSDTCRTACLVFCDRPSNDFGSLARVIGSMSLSESVLHGFDILPSMVPRSYFHPIVPKASVDAGFSFSALHHLNSVPARYSPGENRHEVFHTQACTDLRRFLQLRALEFKYNAPLVLTFVGTASSGVENYAPLVASCKTAMAEMIRDSTIPSNVLEYFEVLVYDRSMTDVLDVLAKEEDSWAVDQCVEKMIQHPASVARHATDHFGSDLHRLSSAEYAQVVVEWEMAVIGGYFADALRQAISASEADQDRLLREWTRRTVEVFQRLFRDAIIECCVIFVKLRRKENHGLKN